MSINDIPAKNLYGMMPPWTCCDLTKITTQLSDFVWVLGQLWYPLIHYFGDISSDTICSRPVDCGKEWKLVPANEAPIGDFGVTRDGITWGIARLDGTIIASDFVERGIIAIRRPVEAKKKVCERCGGSGCHPNWDDSTIANISKPCPACQPKQESTVEQTSREAQLMAYALQFGPKPKQTNKQAMEKAWEFHCGNSINEITSSSEEDFKAGWNAAQSAKEAK